MQQEDVKQIADAIVPLLEGRRYRHAVSEVARWLAKWVALLGAVAAVVTFVINGTELFTRTIPQFVRIVAKQVLQGATFRDLLLREAKEQLGYGSYCVIRHQMVDLDGDEEATDLILTLNPPGQCKAVDSPGALYAILKEVEWTGTWPTYGLVHLVTRDGPLAGGFPMTFEVQSPYVIGSLRGTDFPSLVVYGYANGTLHLFGRYKLIGSLPGNRQGLPRAVLGNLLFVNGADVPQTASGLWRFQVAPAGDFPKPRLMTAADIVQMNNAVTYIEDLSNVPEERKSKLLDATPPTPGCPSVFLNEARVEFTAKDGKCTASLEISRSDVLAANVPCSYAGFRQAGQFPWGWIFDDAAKTKHVIQCPVDGENGPFQYEFAISLK